MKNFFGRFKKIPWGSIIKKMFGREVVIFDLIKSIRLKDVNIAGAIIAIILMIINLLAKNVIYFPIIWSQEALAVVLLLLIGIYIAVNKQVDKRDLNAFVCLQILLLFTNFLVNSIFPFKLDWLKLVLSAYIILNFFVFILVSLQHQENTKKVDKKEKAKIEKGKKEKQKKGENEVNVETKVPVVEEKKVEEKTGPKAQ